MTGLKTFSSEAAEILRDDFGAELLEQISVRMRHEYEKLRERAEKETLPPAVAETRFLMDRSRAAENAISVAMEVAGLPCGFRRLPCNGQQKLLAKIGRVLLIQEPLSAVGARPQAAEYKRQLARVHSAARQLELDLGDRPHQNVDWSGDVLAVLLHGHGRLPSDGGRLGLASLRLAVPDADYRNWIVNLPLERISVWGDLSRRLAEAESKDVEDRVATGLRRARSVGWGE